MRSRQSHGGDGYHYYSNRGIVSNNYPGIRSMTSHAIRQYYNRLLHSIGIRKEGKRRQEFSVHGFRKYFKTKAEIAGMKPINIETLMGHSTGISDLYYRPSESELLTDYLHVADPLTISEEKQLNEEVLKLKKMEVADIDIMKKNYLDMKLTMEVKDKHIDMLSDSINSLSDQLSKVTSELEIVKQQQGLAMNK